MGLNGGELFQDDCLVFKYMIKTKKILRQSLITVTLLIYLILLMILLIMLFKILRKSLSYKKLTL
ncbi:protein of unknown function [Streptococcus thermophilus]|nr:protein of unknown function [Streptococcus thermophilus]CAD0145266.1 protein of unknown function [Streptococcus thermophilus]CAD0147710.1 protein of unknown function [Streptococcus thermophilus]